MCGDTPCRIDSSNYTSHLRSIIIRGRNTRYEGVRLQYALPVESRFRSGFIPAEPYICTTKLNGIGGGILHQTVIGFLLG